MSTTALRPNYCSIPMTLKYVGLAILTGGILGAIAVIFSHTVVPDESGYTSCDLTTYTFRDTLDCKLQKLTIMVVEICTLIIFGSIICCCYSYFEARLIAYRATNPNQDNNDIEQG